MDRKGIRARHLQACRALSIELELRLQFTIWRMLRLWAKSGQIDLTADRWFKAIRPGNGIFWDVGSDKGGQLKLYMRRPSRVFLGLNDLMELPF